MYRLIPVLLIALVFTFTNCGGENSSDEVTTTAQTEAPSDDPMTTTANSLRKAADQIESMRTDDKKEVIDYKELKAMMPDDLLGIDRTSLDGSKSGAMGYTVSQANATYKNDDQEIVITMVDATGLGAARASMAAWLTMEFDRESDDGYERTVTIDGMKAYEKYDHKRKKGQVSVFAKDQLLVNIEGTNVAEEDLRKVLKEMDL